RLGTLNIAPGSRCLELGAGRGSIARWLSDQVGPHGTVVAADIDCRFLTGLPDNVEVRQLDIRDDDLEPDRYDLVHCRMLLGHLPDPLAALQRMAAALRAGGIVLAEEVDDRTYRFYGHPDADWATGCWRRQANGMLDANIADTSLGRELPGLLIDAGLTLTGGEVEGGIAGPGEPPYQWWQLSLESMAPAFIAAGFSSEDDHARVMRMMRSGTARWMSPVLVAAWARRPARPHNT
ncbi:MAG TPA: class I SAM-dependent methyltransferase, partial [Pseudonocardia sp.]